MISCLLVVFGLSATAQQISAAPQAVSGAGRTSAVKDTSIDWMSYDSGSIAAKQSISVKDLQGTWIAIAGVYRLNNRVNALHLTESASLEISGDAYRQNENGSFKKFVLYSNLLISAGDTAVINKITGNSLIVSWKTGDNYIRYYYTK